MSRIADIPADVQDLEELRRLVNDRLQRLGRDAGSAADVLKNVPAAQNGKDAVPLQQMMATIAALEARLRTSVEAAAKKKEEPKAADPVATQGGQVALSVPGLLAIESNAAPLISFKTARQVNEVELLVKQAPVGADLKVRVLVEAAPASTITLPATQSLVRSGEGFSIAAERLVRVDVLQVGTVFPGADLSVILRFA